MIDFGAQLVLSGALSLALSGALFWLLRSWISERLKSAIKHEYDEKLESHKAQLQAQAAVETERLRSQLSIQATEHAVRFQRLHEKRAEVVEQLYSLLTEAYRKASTFASPVELTGGPGKDEQYIEAHNSLFDFFQYFDRNRIYLPTSELCDSIDQLVEGIRRQIASFGMYTQHKDEGLNSKALERKYDAWMRAWEFMEKEVPLAKAKLEDEFRFILGG
ncbi:hypothetical protein [Xanthomonas sontii]|uniref:hypothetical protein n=1 Tax=Xanthomonas sontii TaxID=2650745 RepID=UPI00123CE62D|nr:hypothetical protein [Xanthomonas sontii]